MQIDKFKAWVIQSAAQEQRQRISGPPAVTRSGGEFVPNRVPDAEKFPKFTLGKSFEQNAAKYAKYADLMRGKSKA